jgi:tetratricopeptide (TPR) repeat protein
MKNRVILTISIVFLLFWGVPHTQAEETKKWDDRLPAVRISKKAADFLKAGNWADAADELTEMFMTPGADPNIKYYLAMCYLRMGEAAFKENKFQQALSHFENGLIYTNDAPSLHFGLGLCYFKLSNYSRAEDALTELLALDPNHYLAHKILGEIYYLANDLEKAAFFWEKAIKINGTDSRLKKRLSNLKKQMKLSQDFDTEIDNIFTVTFDGERNPHLRDNVMAALGDIYQEIGYQLNLYPGRQIPVILLTKEAFFDITGSPKWSGGIYEGQIKIPVENYKPEILKIVLCHEYVHAVIFDTMSNRCPWWLNEGLAQYFSGDKMGNRLKLELASQLLASGDTPSLKALPGEIGQDVKQVQKAYALALSAVDYLIEFHGVFQVQSILEVMGEGRSFDAALLEITGYTFKEFESNWKESMKR